MAHLHQTNTREVPSQLLDAARAALAAHGPRRGAELLGLSRNALLSMLATGRAMPGTIALMQQNQGNRAA